MNRPATRLMLVLAALLLPLSSPGPILGQSTASDDREIGNGSSEEEPTGDGQAPFRPSYELHLETILPGGTDQGFWPGFGFGLGLLAFTDRQGSLRNTLSQSTVTLRDPFGGMATTVVDVDTELNNRKFDFELDLKGGGVYVPITLRSFGDKGSLILGFEAAETDVSFETFDTTAESVLSSAFTGSGPMYGVELETRVCASPLCRSIWSASYGYRYLPRLGVDRGLAPGDPRFDVLEDEVAIFREAHEIAIRTSYSLGTGDRLYAPYAGVLYRDVEVEIQDHLRFLDGFEIDRTQETISRFGSGTMLGILGASAQLGSVSGHVESFFGEGDYGVRFQLAWSLPGSGRVKKSSDDKLSSKQRKRRAKRRMKRAAKVTPLLAAGLARIEADFVAGRAALDENRQPPGQTRYVLADVLGLVEATGRDIRGLLRKHQLPALDAYFQQLLAEAVTELESGVLRPGAGPRGDRARAAVVTWGQHVAPRGIAPAAFGQPGQALRFASGPIELILVVTAKVILDRLENAIQEARFWADNNDIYVDVKVESEPDNARVRICPAQVCKQSTWDERDTNDEFEVIPRGYYLYSVERDGVSAINCLPGTSNKCPYLKLTKPKEPMICCPLSSTGAGSARCSVHEKASGCPDVK